MKSIAPRLATTCLVPLALAFSVVWFSTRLFAAEAPAVAGTDARFDGAVAAARAIIEKEIAPKTPGLSVAISVDGRLVWSGAFGFADIGTKRPVTTTTRFRIGSTSKPLTSAGLALLVERGALDLDAPVQKYVPDFPAKPEGVITTRLLGGHLSGIRHYRGRESFSNVHYENVHAGLKIFADDPLEAPPGTKFIYSTYGWCVISAAMESAAQEEFTVFMEKNVFSPLAMSHTRPDRAGADDPERSSFYESDANGNFVAAPTVDCGFKVAGGGILSTPEDLLRFAAALWQPGFLQESSLKLLFTPQKTSDGQETKYGIGWLLGKDRQGHPIYLHTGGSMGGTSVLLLYPHTRTAIAMTSNHTRAPFNEGQVWRIVELISAAAAKASSPDPEPAGGPAGPVPAQSVPDIVGTWHGTAKTPGGEITLVLHVERGADATLSAKLENASQNPGNLRPIDEITVTGGHLAFRNVRGNPSYAGDWDGAARQWKGTLTARVVMALDFTKGGAVSVPWQLPPDSEISKLIAERNAPRAGQGIVVGVLGPDGRRIVAGGTGAGAGFDRGTLFEIGSISKVFTALILADMVNQGEVSLDDPAAKYLPAGHQMPEHNGRQITLRDLSTHRSGLPRMADDMRPIHDPNGPFADYDEKRLLAFLDRCELTRDPGAEWEYSNLGAGLLGYLLARAAHSDYETLLRERITRPLHMDDTMITLPPPEAARLAPGFDAYLRPVEPWDCAVLAGMGGIRSSAADMLTFAAAVMDLHSPIAPAVKTTLSVRVPSNSPQVDQALGWQVLHPTPGREVLQHAGQTGGYRAMLALEPRQGRAVVALANTAAEPSTVDLGLHILLGRPVAPTPAVSPAPPPPTQHTEIPLSAEQLEKVAGRYDFGPGFIIAITREGTVLRALREGVARARPAQIFPEAPLAFFWKAVDAQIRFTTGANGAVTGAEFSQGGQLLAGKRLTP